MMLLMKLARVFTEKVLGELGESNERIEEVMRACLLPDRSSWSSWELAKTSSKASIIRNLPVLAGVF